MLERLCFQLLKNGILWMKGRKEMRALNAMLVATAVTVPSQAQSKMLGNDDQIRQVFVGNTVSGVEQGESYVEFYFPDGRIGGEGREGAYSGHWQIVRGRMCLSYDVAGGKATPWDCARVGLEGSRIVWAERGEKSFSVLKAGNPKGF